MKKVFYLLITLSLSLLLVSCTNNEIQIGVLQFATHNALDDSYRGFVDELAEHGFVDGENIKINLMNPEGDQATMQNQAKSLVRKNDLTLGIATPAAIALKTESDKGKRNKPLLFTAVTDPVDAKLIKSNENPGGNVTGTNDLNPISEQLALAKELLPNLKKIGILYSANEPNSSIQAEIAKTVLNDLEIDYEVATFISASDIDSVARTLARNVDLIYTPTDNLVASNIGVLNIISTQNNVPFIVGEDTLVSSLPSLTIGVDYYELGRLTGKMAVDILNGKKPSDIPSVGLEDFNLAINKDKLESIGIEIPEELLDRLK